MTKRRNRVLGAVFLYGPNQEILANPLYGLAEDKQFHMKLFVA